jgi:cell wall-associated NlpC family hydrolase
MIGRRTIWNPETAFAIAAVFCLAAAPNCRPRLKPAPPPGPAVQDVPTSPAFTIQVGAFASKDNAVRLTQSLAARRLDAVVFAADSGYFKVQIGRFSTRIEAEQAAASLLRQQRISEYLIVPRLPRADAVRVADREDRLREELAATAQSFISYPYAWGGDSPEKGFDCSGLTMTVFLLNGLSLPRSLLEQYGAGRSVARNQLKKGDLVFFLTGVAGTVTHVGIYIGDQMFIHAPGRTKTVRTDSLLNPYFGGCFAGARSYF